MSDYSKLKIEWCGEILADIGYGVQARAILRPLIQGGADVKIIPAEDYVPESRRIKDPFWLACIEASKTKPDMPIRVNFSIPPQYRPRPGAINIGYTMWETTRLPNEWLPIMRSMNHLFVQSESVVDYYTVNSPLFQEGTPNPKVSVVRPTFEDPSNVGNKLHINEIPDNVIKFMFSSNWVPRKNHADLITAFTAALGGVEDAALILKCWPMDDSVTNKRNIEGGIRHYTDRLRGLPRAKIHLIYDLMSSQAMQGLIRNCDVYVSASRAEGFDSATVAAMAMEKLVIGIPFGIKRDYLTSTCSLPVEYSLEPIIDSAAPGYDPYQSWARPNMESLIYNIRLAYEMKKDSNRTTQNIMGLTATQLGQNAREKVLGLFSKETNTQKIYDKLIEIQGEAKVQEPENTTGLPMVSSIY